MADRTVHPTDIPGLCDVHLSDGRVLRDLTMGQVKHVALREPEVAAWLAEQEEPK